jgi:Matrixin
MASFKQLAACIGLPQKFSVVRHFFGYASAPPWSLAPSQASLPQSLSLLTQMKRLKQKHFHLNVIRVGTSGFDDLLDGVDEQNLDCAVQITRNIYAAVGIGIGRVERWWMISLDDNTGYDVIDDDCEAEDLVDEYSVPNNGVDCFFVTMYLGKTAGIHPDDGVVVESRDESFLRTARTMAHELGHYFGLGHENDKPNNLMCQTGKANPMPGSTQLNSDQVEEIKEHNAMKGSC